MPVGSGSTAAASATKPAAPKADEPPTPDAVRVKEITVKNGTKNGRPWTKWTIVDSNGGETSTFSRSAFDAAEKFKAERTWVEIAYEMNGEYRNLIEIVKAGTEPKLPDLDSET